MSKVLDDSLTKPILYVVLILAMFGIVAMLSASLGKGAVSSAYAYDSLFFFKRQLAFLVVGLVAMFAIQKWFNMEKYRFLLGMPLTIFTMLLLVWALFSSSVNEVNRWISIGGFHFQPGELAKISMILFWADFLAKRQRKLAEAFQPPLMKSAPGGPMKPRPVPPLFSLRWFMYYGHIVKNTLKALLPAIIVTAVVVVLIESGRDLGTIIVISATIFAMVMAAGTPWQFALGTIGGLGLLGGLMICKEAYRANRIHSWLHPLDDKLGDGYQAYNSFIAISKGGIWGCGMPFSRQKFDFLPEMHCDFIYPIICEELGLVGSLGLLLLFLILFTCCVGVAVRCKDPYMSMVSFGISVQIVGQALFNVAVVTGILPNKGLPLPFVSAGGSSLMLSLMSMGLLLNISEHTNVRPKQALPKSTRRKAVRKGATISSSDQQVSVKPVSSREWEAIVAQGRTPVDHKLPRPVIEPSWSKVVIFEPGSRAERERWRRLHPFIGGRSSNEGAANNA